MAVEPGQHLGVSELILSTAISATMALRGSQNLPAAVSLFTADLLMIGGELRLVSPLKPLAWGGLWQKDGMRSSRRRRRERITRIRDLALLQVKEGERHVAEPLVKPKVITQHFTLHNL